MREIFVTRGTIRAGDQGPHVVVMPDDALIAKHLPEASKAIKTALAEGVLEEQHQRNLDKRKRKRK